MWSRVIEAIKRNGNGMSMAEIGRHAGTDKSTVSRLAMGRIMDVQFAVGRRLIELAGGQVVMPEEVSDAQDEQQPEHVPNGPDLELARHIVDKLGGPTKAAQFFEIKPPSISDWLKNGVPRARLRHLRDVRPDVFPVLPEGQRADTHAAAPP